ncbi:ATP-grasp domain-containing protein [Marinobacteraceae bacterium S3BR75-40.1]
MPHRILVLDANQRSALAATRTLGQKDLWVTTADESPRTLAGASRYASDSAVYRSPFRTPAGFLEDVLRIVEAHRIDFILPMTEASTYVLLANRSRLPAHVKLPFPSDKQVQQLANKSELTRLAQSLGLPVPESQHYANAQALLSATSSIQRYPVVLKPALSKILLEDRIVSTSVVIVRNEKALKAALQQDQFKNYPFMVQEFITGEGQGVFTLFRSGRPLCFFAHRRLREKPPEGGVSVLSESRDIDTHMQQIATKLLESAQWDGVAMVEFKVSADGTPYLMEVNPRFWGSLQLAIDAGVDFPYFLYRSVYDPHYQPPSQFPAPGNRLRWLLGDLDRLYLVLKAPATRYSVSQKLMAVLQFLSYHRKTRHEVNRWPDMAPFWYELKAYIRSLRHG